jgi:hypothetical protein
MLPEGVTTEDILAEQKRRDRWARRRLNLLAVVILFGIAVGLTVQTVVIFHNGQRLQNVTDRTRSLVRAGIEQRKQLAGVLCLVATAQRLTAHGLRQFGVEIPTLPGGPPADCATAGDDVIIGTGADDHINGTPGQDFISGQDGDDRIHGKAGPDTLIAGNGQDNLFGGEGNDTLRAVEDDGARDYLDGGPGHDTCYLRRNDRQTGCEVVTRIG